MSALDATARWGSGRRHEWRRGTGCTNPGKADDCADPQGGSSIHFATIPRKVKLPAEQQNSRLMRAMFSIVAPRYDFITRAFSYGDRKSTRLNSSHLGISYAVFC